MLETQQGVAALALRALPPVSLSASRKRATFNTAAVQGRVPAPARSAPGTPGVWPGLRLLFAGVVLGRRPPRGSFRPFLGRFAASPPAVSAGRPAMPAPLRSLLALAPALPHSRLLFSQPRRCPCARRRAGRFPDLVAAPLLHAHPGRADQIPRRRPRPAPAGARRWQEPGAPNPGQDFPRDSARQTSLRAAVFVASLRAQQGYSLPPRHIYGRFPPKTPRHRVQKQVPSDTAAVFFAQEPAKSKKRRRSAAAGGEEDSADKKEEEDPEQLPEAEVTTISSHQFIELD